MFTQSERSINVSKQRLIDVLTANRKRHEGEFVTAHAAWKAVVKEELEEIRSRVNAGDFSVLSVSAIEPRSNVKDYDNILAMLEYSVDETLTLDQRTFQNYVMDEWGWKSSFVGAVTSNSLLMSKYIGG